MSKHQCPQCGCKFAEAILSERPVLPPEVAHTVTVETLELAKAIDDSHRERREFCNGRAATGPEIILARALLGRPSFDISPPQSQQPFTKEK